MNLTKYLVPLALLPALSASAATISTAFGSGADAQLSSAATYSTATTSYTTPTDTGNGLGTSVNARFNTTTTNASSANSDITALRFDLSGYNLSTIGNVTLSLTSFRSDSSTRAAALLGVTAFATGKDNNGVTAGYDTTTWSESSVKFSTMPGLNWNASINNTITSSSQIDTANTSLLATISVSAPGEGSIVSFSGAALADFIKTHTTTNLVTFLIRSNNTSSGQFRFATKESTALATGGAAAAGTYAPYLTFTASPIPEPSSFAALAGASVLGLVAVRRRRRA